MRRLTIIATTAAALAAACLLAGAAGPPAARGDTPSSPGRTVNAGGHGSIDAVPDRATIGAGVRVEARNAADALTRASAAASRVIAALKGAGGTNLKTQQVSLDPQLSNAGKTTGYVAEETVTADAPVASAGKLVDAATAAGATSISGPSLTVADQSALYRQALRQAVDDARARAQAIAKAGGFALGPIVSVDESSSPPPLPFAASGAREAKPATPVEPGTQEVTADVQVVFSIG